MRKSAAVKNALLNVASVLALCVVALPAVPNMMLNEVSVDAASLDASVELQKCTIVQMKSKKSK